MQPFLIPILADLSQFTPSPPSHLIPFILQDTRNERDVIRDTAREVFQLGKLHFAARVAFERRGNQTAEKISLCRVCFS
jgi:hypothetical protein